MVVVRVEWLAGRDTEQKEALVAEITDALRRIGGAQEENVHVVLHAVPPSNWGRAGKLVLRQAEEQGQDQDRDAPGGTPSSVVPEGPNGQDARPSPRVALPDLAEAGRVFDLEQPRREGMPVYAPHRPGYSYLLNRHHEDAYEQTGPRTSASGVIFCMEHTGTHIDAVCHQADDLNLYGGIPVKEVQTGKGFTRLGAEEIPPIMVPGVLLDVATSHETEALEPGYAVTADDIENCCERQNVTVERGTVVLIRTGNARRYWDDPEGYLAGPGMASDASYWLAERGVVAVGADNMAWDVIGAEDPELGVMLPGHLILLARKGIYIIENLLLEELAAAGVHRFSFFCTPLKFVGATGSPVRPLAIASGGS
jgi:4-oxalocrotonate tautomerase family enzyme